MEHGRERGQNRRSLNEFADEASTDSPRIYTANSGCRRPRALCGSGRLKGRVPYRGMAPHREIVGRGAIAVHC